MAAGSREIGSQQGLSDALLTAILALMIEERETQEADRSRPKIEVLLAGAGLTIPLIATILNKQPDAVRKAISRAREKPGRGGSTPPDADA